MIKQIPSIISIFPAISPIHSSNFSILGVKYLIKPVDDPISSIGKLWPTAKLIKISKE